MSPKVDVLIFTCEAREHLLAKAWWGYAPLIQPFPHRRILAIDGKIDQSVIDLIQPDIVVRNYARRGYIHSILNALALVHSEYFLWLEDDWFFNANPQVGDAIAALEQNPSWMQVRWSRVAPLTSDDISLAQGIHFSSVGFSANPAVCRTQLMREGFDFVRNAPKGNSLGVDGFENVLTKWSIETKHPCAVFDPGNKPAVTHIGDLESTGREWHMTASVENLPQEHLPVAGSAPALWRRFWMVWKLTRSFASVCFRQFFSNRAYDLAFRIMASERDLVKKSKKRDEQARG